MRILKVLLRKPQQEPADTIHTVAETRHEFSHYMNTKQHCQKYTQHTGSLFHLPSDRNCLELSMTFRNGLHDGRLLRAYCQRVGRVLDVAT